MEPAAALGARRRRAVALTALALIATAVASFAYLRPDVPASDVNPLLVSTNPMSFAFVTPSIGWASLLVVGSGSDAGQYMLFRTTDGAQHWQQQLVLGGRTSYDPDTFVHGPAPTISVQMFGKTRGFMTLGGQLFRTNDGGAHWDSFDLPPSLRIEDLVFSDPSNGWLVAESISIGDQSRSLYASRDGGNTWERLAHLPVDAFGLVFRRPTETWLGSGGGPPHVYTSGDVGVSWQRHDLPAPAGRSWTSDGYCPSFQTEIQLLPGVGAIASVAVITPLATSTSSGTASCDHGGSVETFFMMSRDVGITWKQVPPPPGVVAYQDSTHWWATRENTLFKSTDAGQTWGRVATISADWQFSAPDILDSAHAWAAVSTVEGYGLAVTEDGGLHWRLANVPNPAISP